MILINLLLMHIIGIGNLMKGVMLWFICPEHYHKHHVKKLHARTIGPYPNLRRLESNAYLIDLPSNMFISPIFNMANLFPY